MALVSKAIRADIEVLAARIGWKVIRVYDAPMRGIVVLVECERFAFDGKPFAVTRYSERSNSFHTTAYDMSEKTAREYFWLGA